MICKFCNNKGVKIDGILEACPECGSRGEKEEQPVKFAKRNEVRTYRSLNQASDKYGLEELAPGTTEVWFQKDASHFYKKSAKTSPLSETHVKLANIRGNDKEEVYSLLQEEVYSPRGEAKELLSKLGIHSSMTEGDVLVVEGQAWVLGERIFEKVANGPGGHAPDGTGPYGRGMGPGKGKADGSGQLEIGTDHEMEHTNDPEEARKIAQDHLEEDPQYYTKLEKCMPEKEVLGYSRNKELGDREVLEVSPPENIGNKRSDGNWIVTYRVSLLEGERSLGGREYKEWEELFFRKRDAMDFYNELLEKQGNLRTEGSLKDQYKSYLRIGEREGWNQIPKLTFKEWSEGKQRELDEVASYDDLDDDLFEGLDDDAFFASLEKEAQDILQPLTDAIADPLGTAIQVGQSIMTPEGQQGQVAEVVQNPMGENTVKVKTPDGAVQEVLESMVTASIDNGWGLVKGYPLVSLEEDYPERISKFENDMFSGVTLIPARATNGSQAYDRKYIVAEPNNDDGTWSGLDEILDRLGEPVEIDTDFDIKVYRPVGGTYVAIQSATRVAEELGFRIGTLESMAKKANILKDLNDAQREYLSLLMEQSTNDDLELDMKIRRIRRSDMSMEDWEELILNGMVTVEGDDYTKTPIQRGKSVITEEGAAYLTKQANILKDVETGLESTMEGLGSEALKSVGFSDEIATMVMKLNTILKSGPKTLKVLKDLANGKDVTGYFTEEPQEVNEVAQFLAENPQVVESLEGLATAARKKAMRKKAKGAEKYYFYGGIFAATQRDIVEDVQAQGYGPEEIGMSLRRDQIPPDEVDDYEKWADVRAGIYADDPERMSYMEKYLTDEELSSVGMGKKHQKEAMRKISMRETDEESLEAALGGRRKSNMKKKAYSDHHGRLFDIGDTVQSIETGWTGKVVREDERSQDIGTILEVVKFYGDEEQTDDKMFLSPNDVILVDGNVGDYTGSLEEALDM